MNKIVAFLSLLAICLMTAVASMAQTAISPTTWTGHGASASGASAFTSLPASTTPGATTVTISQWDRAGSISAATAGSSYNSSNWTSGTSLSAAQSANSYVFFTVTNNATTELEITNVDISTQVSSTGPGNMQLLYAIGSGSDVSYGTSYSGYGRSTTLTYSTSGNIHLCAGETVKFKLYGWNSGSAAGTLRINNSTSISANYVTAVHDTASASPTSLCAGGTINFTGSYSGGVSSFAYAWSGPASFTSSAANPVITSATAAASGTYTLIVTDGYSCSDTATTTVTVAATPTITVSPAAPSICAGSAGTSITASGAGAGGTYIWTPATGLSATTGATVTAAPSSTTRYTVTGTTTSFCSSTDTVTVTVFSGATITSAVTAVCTGDSATLTATPSGTWATSAASIVSVNAITGVIYGASFGGATITFTSTTGCTATVNISVNGSPVITATPAVVCAGDSVTWTGAPSAGGYWGIASASVATVNTATGAITGIAAGTATITYTLTPSGCSAYATITVNALPVISGATSVCTGSSVAWSGSPIGGTWSTSAPTVASVDATATVYGIGLGSSNITYTFSGCNASRSVAVISTPTAIVGAGPLCAGASFFATSTPSGGTWSVDSPSIATIDASGLVTGVRPGTPTITYSVGGTCYATASFTVNRTPVILGPGSVCLGSAITLTGGTGGAWSTFSTTAVSIDASTGIVTGLAADTATIVYYIPSTGCYAGHFVTVNPLPTISGPVALCQGATAIYTSPSGPGSFSSYGTAVTIIAAGNANGTTVGSDTVLYTLIGTGCRVGQAVTVNPLPGAITGPTAVCVGNSITLVEASTTGSWTTSAAGIATVNATGDVTGIAGGPVTISYTFPATGCYATYNITVNSLPAAISGPSTVCLGASGAFSTTTPGGAWATSNASVASVSSSGPTTATAYGLGTGSATLTYTLPTGCYVTFAVSVSTVPAITGAGAVCQGQTITYANTATGGTWTSALPGIATVNAGSGDVYGAAAGNTIITYTLGSGCFDTATVLINPLPALITGGAVGVCESGSVITLSTTSTGGTWSATPASIASINASSGVVTGISAGTLTATYTNITTGCFTTTTVTVRALPSSITGTLSACEGGGTTVLSSSTTGGAWTTSLPAVASVNATGTVTGGIAGTATITYTSGGCYVTAAVTIARLPGAYASPLSDTMLCPGGRVSFLAGTSSGAYYQWYTSGVPISGATTAFYTATAAGNYAVLVSDIYGCSSLSSAVAVTVNPVAATATPAGTTSFCSGGSVVLNANIGAGLRYQWTRGGAAITGATSVSYTATVAGSYAVIVSNIAGCSDVSASITVTILSTPAGSVSASGPLTFCVGNSVVLTADSVAGTTYQWQNGALNIVGATNRTYVAATTGNYRVVESNGSCGATSIAFTVNVLPLPTATVSVTGAPVFCTGSSVVLSAPSVAGYSYQWFSGSSVIAGATTVNYSAASSGAYAVRVTDASGCISSSVSPVTVTEIGLPAVSAAPRAAICQGGTTTLIANLTGTTGVSYQWQLSGVDITGATNATYVASAAGSYNFIVLASAGCTMASPAISIVVSPAPAPVITYAGGRLRTARTYATYQWYRNGTAIFGAITYQITPTDTGRYTVKVIDSGGCDGISAVYYLNSLTQTGVAVIAADDIHIFPNPVNGVLYITAPAAVRVVLQTMDGKVLQTQEHATDMDMSNLAPGIYLLQLQDEAGQLLRYEKVVKQ